MKLRSAVVALVLAAPLMFGAVANANPITGNISFSGDGAPLPPGNDWYNSTGVAFANPWVVITANGDYGTVTPFTTQVTFTNVNWGAGSGNQNVALAQNIWTFNFGGKTYELNVGTVTNILRGSAANNSISVTGTGTLSITGFDDTPGVWNYTAGFAGTAENLSFSSSPPAIPEPATLLLFGAGLLGLAARRRAR